MSWSMEGFFSLMLIIRTIFKFLAWPRIRLLWGNIYIFFFTTIVDALCVACYRYACTLPHAHILFCDIINEFGKKGDLVSALTAYEASKKNSSSTNMYLYRTIIDVCGRCHNYQKSRYIYEVFATFNALFQTGSLN